MRTCLVVDDSRVDKYSLFVFECVKPYPVAVMLHGTAQRLG